MVSKSPVSPDVWRHNCYLKTVLTFNSWVNPVAQSCVVFRACGLLPGGPEGSARFVMSLG